MEKLKAGKMEVLQPFNPSNLQPFNPLILQSFNPSTPQLFKDSAIREMLRRRHAAVPPLSDSFEEKLFAAYEQRHRSHKSGVPMPNRPLTVRRFLWPSIATVAAAAVLLLMLHFAKQPVSTTQLAKTQPPSVNIIVSPKEPSAPTHILSEASSKEKPKTHKRESRVTTQKEVTDNFTATAVEDDVEEKSLAVTTKETTELSSNIEEMRQRMRDNIPFYNLAIAAVKNDLYD